MQNIRNIAWDINFKNNFYDAGIQGFRASKKLVFSDPMGSGINYFLKKAESRFFEKND